MNNLRGEVILLSHTNPIMNHCVRKWQSGNITFEEMMCECVILLSKELDNKNEQLMVFHMNTPAPPIVINNRPYNECNGTMDDESYDVCCEECGLLICECPPRYVAPLD